MFGLNWLATKKYIWPSGPSFRARKEGPDGQMYFFVANQFNPNILSDSVARLIVQWELPTRSRYRKAETAAQHLKLAAFREHPFGQADLL